MYCIYDELHCFYPNRGPRVLRLFRLWFFGFEWLQLRKLMAWSTIQLPLLVMHTRHGSGVLEQVDKWLNEDQDYQDFSSQGYSKWRCSKWGIWGDCQEQLYVDTMSQELVNLRSTARKSWLYEVHLSDMAYEIQIGIKVDYCNPEQWGFLRGHEWSCH